MCRRKLLITLIAALTILLGAIPSPVGGQSATRAIVLAWDGTVPAFVHEMLREGKLPNLAKLIEGGAVADDVVAGFPSKTAPGFASLLTGAPPRITGISGNRVPRAPRGQFTILESLAGFSETPLRAEPIWSVTQQAGKKVIISHIPSFGGEKSDQAVRLAGYNATSGRDGIVTKRAMQTEPSDSWVNSPASEAPPIEISFTIGESKLFGLLIDDPADSQAGYDTIVIATRRDADDIKVKLKSAPAIPGGELFWSYPVAIKAAGNQDAWTYFRLFDLKSDGSDFFLYYTRPARQFALKAEVIADASATVRAFVGNGASILYNQGGFGRTIANGGNGGAEARYLETVTLVEHQLMETNRWALENLPWDLFLAYTPFPDEAEHLWRGYLDPMLANYRRDIAARLRPLLEQVYRTTDEHLGLLLAKRPADCVFALISDHGLQGINKRVALNRVLQEGGLLTLDIQGKVDLAKTKAIYPAVNNGYLLINSQDRKNGIVAQEERAEVVRKTRELLASIRDGEREVVKAIYDAETDGPAMGIGGDVGGDIYVELADGYDFDARIGSGPWITDAEPYGNHGANPQQLSMRTLMVLNGPGIRAGEKLADVRIIDFAPTLAWLLHLPPPKDATGRVLYEAFVEPH
ncbi:MAG TPA: alkaline phosphatase family protein [Verrucomicrobiae bacterium]|nr:alkaline phosphatase family protein [Verrucomicrobiae bacterium]